MDKKRKVKIKEKMFLFFSSPLTQIYLVESLVPFLNIKEQKKLTRCSKQFSKIWKKQLENYASWRFPEYVTHRCFLTSIKKVNTYSAQFLLEFAKVGILLPTSVTKLNICNFYVLKDYFLPNLVELQITDYVDSEVSFPSSLTSLEISGFFDLNLKLNSFPSNLKKLDLEHSTDSLHDVNILPSSLEYLKLGNQYNSPIIPGTLPSFLKVLQFGSNFNQKIDIGVLPPFLRVLRFGSYFNQKINIGVLPSLLECLIFQCAYNQPMIAGSLPESLKKLSFGRQFEQTITVVLLPANLLKLSFHENYFEFIQFFALPRMMKTLKWGKEKISMEKIKMFENVYKKEKNDFVLLEISVFSLHHINKLFLD